MGSRVLTFTQITFTEKISNPATMAPVIKTEPFEEPMSRTQEYRKIVKPLIERKRRARINNCLDELKDLMMFALQTEGESISKLEKADVLELTVKHLRKLRRHQMLTLTPPAAAEDRYQSGFAACASEVNRCLTSIPSVEAGLRTQLMSHLGLRLASAGLPQDPPLHVRVPVATYPSSSSLIPRMSPKQEADLGYISGRDSTPSPDRVKPPASPELNVVDTESVWRPF